MWIKRATALTSKRSRVFRELVKLPQLTMDWQARLALAHVYDEMQETAR
jgi:hypothetical protein